MILLGTCGYSYEDWVGVVYRDIKYALSTYSRIFKAVEIDSTFYNMPSKRVVDSWTRRFPRDFHITMKIPRIITHEKRLREGSLNYLAAFMDAIKPLIDKGLVRVLLVQLPPSLRFDPKGLEEFLAGATSMGKGITWAVEFRNTSWITDVTFKLLEKYGAAFVVVDEPGFPFIVKKTTGTSYVRFHGHGKEVWYDYLYSLPELMAKVPQLLELGKDGDLYIMFNNHPNGKAVLNALQMMQLLGLEMTPLGIGLMHSLEKRLIT